jgi:hypothetical protein
MDLKTYKVDALNLNDVLVSQKIKASSASWAAKIVTRKNKYLRVQSVTLIEEPVCAFEDLERGIS